MVLTDLPDEDVLPPRSPPKAAREANPPLVSVQPATADITIPSAPARRTSLDRKITTMFDRRGSAPRGERASLGERVATLRSRLSGSGAPVRSPSAMRVPGGKQNMSRVRFPSVVLVQEEIAVGTQAAARQQHARALAAVEMAMEYAPTGEIHEGSQPHAELLRDLVGPHEIVDPTALRCDRLLGSGTFGLVYECQFAHGEPPRGKAAVVEAYGGRVAVKMLRSDAQIVESAYDSLTSEEVREAVHELAILRTLLHAHVIGYVGCGLFLDEQGHDQIALLLEYAEHGSIAAVLARKLVLRGPYTFADGLRWVEEIALGLHYLHGRAPAIVHRDLKPENVLLCGAGRVAKLCDFGLSAFVRKRERAFRYAAMLHNSGAKLHYPGARESYEELGDGERPAPAVASLTRAQACAASEYRLTGRTGSLKYMVCREARRARRGARTAWLADGLIAQRTR
jgi:hypothetical protein